jgi:hypothetical protein
MKKKLLFLLLMLMPMSVMATVVVTIDGLEYLDDQDGKGPYIWVAGSGNITTEDGRVFAHTHFIPGPGMRGNFRGKWNNNNPKWYKTDLDAIEELDPSGWKNFDDYQGIEYFRNLKKLLINSSGAASVKLDLSKNTKLETLTFTQPTIRLSQLNISNTKLTSLSIPSGSVNTLANFIARDINISSFGINFNSLRGLRVLDVTNSGLTSLDVSSCSNLQSLTANGLNLTSLTLPDNDNQLKFLYLSGVSGLSTLDLARYAYLEELDVSSSQFTSKLTLPTNTGSLKYLDVSNTGTYLSGNYSYADPWDLSDYIRLVGTGGYMKYDGTGFRQTNDGDAPTRNLILSADEENWVIRDWTGSPEEGGTLDLSSFSNLRGVELTAGGGLVLPKNLTGALTVRLTGSPNIAKVDFSGMKQLKFLDVIDVKSVDVSECKSLVNLICNGDSTKELKLSADNGALKLLNISNSGIKTVDLSHNEAPNLEDFKSWWAPLELLDLSDHASLSTLSLYPALTGDGKESITAPEKGKTFFSEGNKLRVLRLKRCNALRLQTEYDEDLDAWLSILRLNPGQIGGAEDYEIYVALEELDLTGNTAIEHIACQNSMLNKLIVNNCTNLKKIAINQGRLTGNGDVQLSNCGSLYKFIADRHPWETMDFLLKPSEGRSQAAIEALGFLHVNGGSYTILTDRNRVVRENDGEPMLITSRIKELDLSHLKNGTFKGLYCEANLLTDLDISKVGSKLTHFSVKNNMILTIDLSSLNNTTLEEGDWSPQVAFLDVETIKGNYGVALDTGAKDWVALNLPTKGYTHKMDNTLGLYPNLYCELKDSAQIASEADPWMCKVEETDSLAAHAGATEFLDAKFDPSHTGEHIFLHSQNEMGYKDQDLYGKLLKYRYNTGYNQRIENGKPTGEKINDANPFDEHIDVRVHIWPYIMNLNHRTLSTQSKARGVNYYSSTIYLDYDAVIPKGVEVYYITGVTDTTKVIYGGGTAVDKQFDMLPFGKGDVDLSDPSIDLKKPENNVILPAYTPVFVKSKKAAGLYDFQTAWDFKEIKGWENIATIEGFDETEMPMILHGVQKTDERIIRPEYERSVAAAYELKAKLANDGVKNLLTGIAGKKYSTADLEDKNFNMYEKADTTVTRRSVLVLANETQKGTQIIGFWPYNGTTVAAHRCVITGDDFYAATGSTSLDGGTFYFSEDNETTAIKNIDNDSHPADDAWYTPQGIRLNGRPTQPGIYINMGRKVVIK